MDNDSFTEVSSQSWFSRIGESLKGIIFGLLLFAAAFPLLWWNEGRSVERYNSLQEGQSLVVSVSADSIDPVNEGKLIYTRGLAGTSAILQDEVFGISVNAIKLIRHVSMYQWQEDVTTETKEELGGGTTTRKSYHYSKIWSTQEINSGTFKRPAGHENPAMLYQNRRLQADEVFLGAFKLNAGQVNRIIAETDFNTLDSKAPAELNGRELFNTGSGFYLGENPSEPQIGDLRIGFAIVQAQQVSIVAQQQGNGFSAYQTSAGSPIDLLKPGLLEADAMFAAAQKENTLLTWGIRIGGTLLMWLGLSLMFKPLSVFASVIPLLGDLLALGAGILALLITLPCAMLTIALAWISYRPIFAAVLILLALLWLLMLKFVPHRERVLAGSH